MAIVKKYSDYVRYPIQMERQHERQKPEPDPKPEDYKPEWETYTELETLNSMVPVWKKQKSEVTDEEYANFYKEKVWRLYRPRPRHREPHRGHCKL